MKRPALSLLPLILMAAAACHKENDPLAAEPDAGYATYTLTAATQTKSDLVSEADASLIRDVRLAVYTGGKRVASGRAPLELRLMADRSYNYYAWTGSSLPLDEVPEDESGLAGWEAVYPGWDTAGDGPAALDALLSGSGMPMAGSCLERYPGSIAVDGTITVPLERLFARVRLEIAYDETMALLLPERSVQRVCAHNWAWACRPFGTGFDRDKVHAGSIDLATTADSDGRYTVYLPENLQGARASGDPERCSYLSVDMSFGDGIGLGGGVGDVSYRFYPGNDGFNIRRNRQYNVTLTLSYDGRFIEGEWKVSGDDADGRSLAFDAENSQPTAPPGGKAYLRLSYRRDGSADAIGDYFNRYNGVAVGLEAETEGWVENGTAPARSALEVVGSVRCRHCGNRFWGYPEALIARARWAEERLDDAPEGIRCPVCRTLFYEDGSSAEGRFRSGNPLATDPFQISAPQPHVAVTIPGDAAAGSVVRFRAVTRDGRQSALTLVSVGDGSAPVFDQPVEGEQYVAEKIHLRPLSLPADVSELRYRVTGEAGRVEVSRTADGGADLRFLAEGDADILVEDQNGTVRQRISRTVLLPGLRFLSTEYALDVDGTDLAPQWTYTRRDGTAYTDYDETLYDTLLGDPVLSVDGLWTAVSGGNVHIRRTHDDELGDIPYLGTSVGTLTAASPRLPAITGTANLRAVNPFAGWPSAPLAYTIDYGWAESLKKATSVPVQYDGSMSLRNLIGNAFPLYAQTLRGNPPFSYSEAEARAGVPISPTVTKRPSVTSYYGQVTNRHSGTALRRYYVTVAVNVEAYCTESHTQTADGNTDTWAISVTCRNAVGAVPTSNELTRVFTENRTAAIYPTSGRWGHGITGCYWLRAYYTFGVQNANYEISMVMQSQAESGTGDATFGDFAGQNPVQFTTPYVLDDGYTYLQIEGEPLGSPSDQGVWKIRFNPDWQLD